jgi:PAS domain S-box-containing protein
MLLAADAQGAYSRKRGDEAPGRIRGIINLDKHIRPPRINAPVAIACCDTEARYKFVNRHYAERHGLRPEQVVGKCVLEIVGEQAWSTYEPYFRECLAGKTIEFELEIDLPYSVGERQFVHCCYELEWSNRKVVGLVATITNITSRKRAEQRLRDNEITFRQLVETSPFGI